MDRFKVNLLRCIQCYLHAPSYIVNWAPDEVCFGREEPEPKIIFVSTKKPFAHEPKPKMFFFPFEPISKPGETELKIFPWLGVVEIRMTLYS